MSIEIRFPVCNDNHALIAHGDGPCPLCKALVDCQAALDKLAQLEFEVGELEQKVRLLES
jgi:hypothetical protein